ncbi:MAG: antirestriction protein ArdA [Algicola sp.]|nr:antirestriction protein ArdA [Algicola sp.]
MTILETSTQNADIKIYVADLAAYNAGHLHGVWIDATEDLGDMQNQINAMLKKSPVGFAEEYAVHDYDGFEGCSLYEYEDIESIHNKALFIEEYGEVGARLLAHVADNIDEATRLMEDAYHGEFKSVADYAQDLTESCGDIPEHLAFYIDYERMGRDIEINDIFTIETAHDEIHIFSNS